MLRFPQSWLRCGVVLDDDPLTAADARELIREIIAKGNTAFSAHARKEMAKDKLSALDVTNVLRGGTVQPPEHENGSWRYRVQTQIICVCIAFRSRTTLVVVTAWRF